MSDYIPPELIPNILARLPVDDVLRCTSVCKSWYSLITSPSFASSHLNLSSPNQEPRLLIRYIKYAYRTFSYCLHHDNQTFDEIAKLDLPFKRNDWDIIDCINGLVCLFDYHKNTIVLWNPSLKKSLILPKSRVCKTNFGFGFEATSNVYKIICFSYNHYETSKNAAEIYELGTGSWRNLEVDDYSYSYLDVNFGQAHLNGVLHWFTRISKPYPTFSTLICSFDLKNEKFGSLMVPSCLDGVRGTYFIPSTFRESLCLIQYDSDGLSKIWVMKEYGIADSWEMLYIIDKEEHNLIPYPKLRHNGELLFRKFCYETRDYSKELVFYDCNNNQVKNFGVLANTPRGSPAFSVNTYLESLVLIKGPNEVEIDEDLTRSSKDM